MTFTHPNMSARTSRRANFFRLHRLCRYARRAAGRRRTVDGWPLLLQASQQLEGSGIELMRMGQPGVPEIPALLRDHVPENGWIGFDSRTISNDFARSIGEKTREKHIRFAGDEDLVDLVWANRPALSCEPVWELDVKYAGLTRREKLAMVRGKMKEMGASVFVIPSLDEVAWLLNLRGNDVLFTPVFLSYLLLEQDTATLCVQREAVSAEIEAHLKSDGVTLAPYDDIYRLVAALPTGTRVLLDGERANYRILQSVPESAEVLDRTSPIQLMKAVKTPAEQENERLAHIRTAWPSRASSTGSSTRSAKSRSPSSARRKARISSRRG